MPEIAVIGGGAAGLAAAIFAAREGASVSLYEKNEKVGKKLYITGKGRCNFTNLCDTQQFLSKVMRNPRFLYSALNCLSPEDMIALIEENGCRTKVERGQRAFPVSDKASDITRALVRAAERAGARILTRQGVRSLRFSDIGGRIAVSGLELESGETAEPGAVIIATGGLSYPSTGSTGDGYVFAGKAGHHLLPRYPSLTGVTTSETWPAGLQGLSLKNVRLDLEKDGRKVRSALGEMLFTHYGVSGPLILEMSSVLSGEVLTGYQMHLDMKPALSVEQLERKYVSETALSGKKTVRHYLESLLPKAMAPVVCALENIPDTARMIDLDASRRRKLLEKLKDLTLTPAALRPFSEAVVTRGGVDVKEVEPGTMRSRFVSNLYFAGEVLDVDALTGGFNLQIAFATGALAGKSAADALLR